MLRTHLKLNYNKIHPQFQINGTSLDRDGLIELAYNFIKTGKEFEEKRGRDRMR